MLTFATQKSTGRVRRGAGDFGGGVILGLSVITAGEAAGHGLWIDSTFLDQVVNAARGQADRGVKSRFAHPPILDDGLGALLGAMKNFRREGDQVLADLHLLRAASSAPDGDLAGYVMDLADEAPGMFGVSIAFDEDFQTMRGFMAANTMNGRFKSPDQRNVGNLPHARLARLSAADLVDEPAANPAGAFSTPQKQMAFSKGQTMKSKIFSTTQRLGQAALELVRIAGARTDRRCSIGSDEAGTYSDPAGGALVGAAPLLALRSALFGNAGRVLSRCSAVELDVPSGAAAVPLIDETTRADGSRFGGLVVSWKSETAAIDLSRVKAALARLDFCELVAALAVSNEAMRSAVGIGTLLQQCVETEAVRKLEGAIIRGSGVGQPLGILNTPALIEVAAEDGQTAGTLNATNIQKMFRRLPAESFATACWLVNPLLADQWTAALADCGPIPGAGGLHPALLPVIPHEACSAPGSRGDVVLADLTQYFVASRPRTFMASAHVRFESDETVLRLIWELDTQPLWSSPITPDNSVDGLTVSPFIALAERGE